MGMDVYGNSGNYFRANCWGWRPIHAMCDIAISKYNLPLSTYGWGYNDGMGLSTTKECHELADKLEEMINTEFVKDDVEYVYLCLGSWCTPQGSFVPNEIEKELNDKYPEGTIMFTSIVLPDGMIVQSSHSNSIEKIKEFIEFLRASDGFQIF